MSGQIQETIKEKTLSDKFHLMAETLRNCQLKRCIGKFYDPRNDSFCAYGALGFMAGISKDDLTHNDFNQVLRSYEMNLDDQMKAVRMPELVDYPERVTSIYQALYLMNDHGASWTDIADQLDIWADNL
jgi:hypothetical protein